MKEPVTAKPENKNIHEKSASGVLFFVSLSVFLATSVWFSGTAAAPILKEIWQLSDVQMAWLTVAVQLGFIAGTFLYSIFNLADIFRARNVFFLSAVLSALFNGIFALFCSEIGTAVLFRFLTGVTLAGVYPVGMKLVASWFRTGLGWRLGVMVGALTLGTAFPYFIQAVGAGLNWKFLASFASILALVGGLIVLRLIPEGPYLREIARFDIRAAFRMFRRRSFRLQAFGYFGHMWELYTFWALSSVFFTEALSRKTGEYNYNIPLVAFLIISVGTAGCILGGWVSRTWGERKVALLSLCVSGGLCFFSWLLFGLPSWVLIIILLIWGFFVVADSPQFSALAAVYCPPEYTGTAFAIQNGIGFGITVVSLQVIPWIAQTIGWQWAFIFLAPGPILGVAAMIRLKEA